MNLLTSINVRFGISIKSAANYVNISSAFDYASPALPIRTMPRANAPNPRPHRRPTEQLHLSPPSEPFPRPIHHSFGEAAAPVIVETPRLSPRRIDLRRGRYPSPTIPKKPPSKSHGSIGHARARNLPRNSRHQPAADPRRRGPSKSAGGVHYAARKRARLCADSFVRPRPQFRRVSRPV